VVLERSRDLVPVGIRVDLERVRDMDAFDDEDAVVDLDLAAPGPDQPPLARIDLARLQRASKRPSQSAGGRRDDVVEGRRALCIAAPRDAVVVGDLVMDSEEDRLGRTRNLGASQRSAYPLDSDRRRIDDLSHAHRLDD
jgi:hypothetical protein